MKDRISFYDQIEKNKRNSWILVIIVFICLFGLTAVMSIILAFNLDVGLMFIFFAAMSVFNIAYILYTYYKSDSIAIGSVGAYPAKGPRYDVLNNIVEEMSIAGGLPMPKVYVMPSRDINAFATGRDPEHSSVCVTEGCLEKLNRQELKAVVAHEMTHIRNYDIRFVTLVAVMVGLVSIISQMFLRSMFFAGGGRGRRGGGNIMLLVLGLLLAILAPIIVKIVQLSISRKREYMADAGAVEMTRYPLGMVQALKKIREDYARPTEHTNVNSAVAPMFLESPKKSMLSGLFQTHPPIDDRIDVLSRM